MPIQVVARPEDAARSEGAGRILFSEYRPLGASPAPPSYPTDETTIVSGKSRKIRLDFAHREYSAPRLALSNDAFSVLRLSNSRALLAFDKKSETELRQRFSLATQENFPHSIAQAYVWAIWPGHIQCFDVRFEGRKAAPERR